MLLDEAETEHAIPKILEELGDLRMPQRLVGFVGQEILLRDIGHILGVRVLGKKMLVGLVLGRPHILRDGLVPFFGIGEGRVHIEDDAPEGIDPVPDNLADLELCAANRRHDFTDMIVGAARCQRDGGTLGPAAI
jgi:hypothetical protein